MLERFDHVHLITYRRCHLWFVRNAELHVGPLKARFGNRRLCHVYLDCTRAFRQVFYERLDQDTKKYGTHLALLVCLGCKMAMHARTIIYNLEHGVARSAAGSRHESKLYPAQMRSVKERIEEMYRDYGMEIESPVYDLTDTDRLAYEQGLVARRNMKQQFIFYDSQPSCLYGGVAYVYSRLFYAPLFGAEARQADALQYFDDKRPVVDAIVRRHFARKGQDVSRRVADLRASADHR